MAGRQVSVDKEEYNSLAGLQSSSSGSAGGMDMMSGFTQLGSQINKDSNMNMQYFQQMFAATRERERQAMLDAEDKRRFNVGAAQQNRQQNMSGIAMLGQARQNADTMSRQRSFRNDLSAALRRA